MWGDITLAEADPLFGTPARAPLAPAAPGLSRSRAPFAMKLTEANEASRVTALLRRAQYQRDRVGKFFPRAHFAFELLAALGGQ